jgi:hypothetical protein
VEDLDMVYQESRLIEDIRPEQTVVGFDPAFPEYAVVGVSPRVVDGLTVYDEVMWIYPDGSVAREVMGPGRNHAHAKGAIAHMLGIAEPQKGDDGGDN